MSRRAREAGDALSARVDNECLLPAASSSEVAAGLQRWCKEGSWGMCPKCGVLQPRPLREADLTNEARPEIMAYECRRCKAKRPHMVPKPDDVPEPLQGLSPEIVEALRPLDIDVGEEVRAGTGSYRKKVRMITFSWALQSVDSKIACRKHSVF